MLKLPCQFGNSRPITARLPLARMAALKMCTKTGSFAPLIRDYLEGEVAINSIGYRAQNTLRGIIGAQVGMLTYCKHCAVEILSHIIRFRRRRTG